MTLHEAAYNILNLLVGGRSTNNEYISLDQIKYEIKYYRALLLRRNDDKSARLTEFEQVLRKIPIEKSFSVYADIKVGTIPKTVRFRDGLGLSFVGILGQERYALVDYNRANLMLNDKYIAGKNACYMLGDDLYLSIRNSPITPEYIDIVGVFEDPEEAHNFWATQTLDTDNIFLWDDKKNEFPITGDMYQQIVTAISNNEMRLVNTVKDNDTVLNTIPSKND